MQAIASRITSQPVWRLQADVVSLGAGKNVQVIVPISRLKNIVK